MLCPFLSGPAAIAAAWNLDRDAAEAAMQSKNYSEAEIRWKDALAQTSGISDPRYGTTIRALANVYILQGNTTGAEHLYAQAASAAQKSKNTEQNCWTL